MAKFSSTPYSFLSGFVQSRDVGRVIAQVDELRELGATDSALMKWTRADGKWGSYHLEWTATRIWVLQEPVLQVFAMGPAGFVNVGTIQGDQEEEIDGSNDGPSRRGDMRDLRFIGKHLYAAGMSRQVYRREGPNRWVRRDAGVVQPRGTLDVAGFNAIDGLRESDIYAVGFGGEIWRCVNGKWYQIDSPTNLVLHRVRVIAPDLVFACGQEGLLLRGQGDVWEPILHGDTDEDLWGMESFMGSLYLACDSGLYRLNENDGLDPIDMGLGEPWTYRHLHANDGVMWSFGAKHLAWTDDAVIWHDVTP